MKKQVVIIFGVCLLLSGCSSKSSEPEISINRDSITSTEAISSTDDIITSDTQSTTKVQEIIVETTVPSEVETTAVDISNIDITYVKDIISNLLRCTSQSEVDNYLSYIEISSSFIYKPVVNKDTKVSIESIGVNNDNNSEYLGIVTLRQQGGISKFAIVVSFDYNKLDSFEITKF